MVRKGQVNERLPLGEGSLEFCTEHSVIVDY
jgi:hypothetical protein